MCVRFYVFEKLKGSKEIYGGDKNVNEVDNIKWERLYFCND